MSTQKSEVWILDVETSPILAYVWELFDQNVALNQIKKDWHIMAWSAKKLGDKNVIYRETRNGDDRAILKDLWKILDSAEIIITQNGKKFDARKINARFITHKMRQPSPYKHWDTLRLVRSVASFTSNKLEYLTNTLNTKYKKLSHSEFPGFSLWAECLEGNPKAWAAMRRYNIHDVLSTEELALNLRSWAPESFPAIFNVTDAALECGTCGAVGKMREGKLRRSKTHRYRQHACLKCGAWQKGAKV